MTLDFWVGVIATAAAFGIAVGFGYASFVTAMQKKRGQR